MPKKNNSKKVFVEDGFENVQRNLGRMSSDTQKGDTYAVSRLTQNYLKLEAMYRSSWIVSSVIDIPAEDMTRNGITMVGLDSDEEIKMRRFLMEHGIWNALFDGKRWGRLYGGAIGIIDIANQDPATPLRLETVGKNSFKSLFIHDRSYVTPSFELDQDMLPKYYTVSIPSNTSVGTFIVDRSRVIRFIGDKLPMRDAFQEMMWGESVLEKREDSITSLERTMASLVELLDKANLRFMGIDGFREILAQSGGDDKLLKSLLLTKASQSLTSFTVHDSKDTIANQTYNFSGVDLVVKSFEDQISGAFGIPSVRLFGQTPSGLGNNSDSNIRMYYDEILSNQESELRTPIGKLMKIIYRSEYGKDLPEDFYFNFVPSWQMTQLEKSQYSTATTNSIVQTYNSGIIDLSTALNELKKQSITTNLFSSIDDAQIEEAKNKITLPDVETLSLPSKQPPVVAEPKKPDIQVGEETSGE